MKTLTKSQEDKIQWVKDFFGEEKIVMYVESDLNDSSKVDHIINSALQGYIIIKQ
jgi:hypothetical protein